MKFHLPKKLMVAVLSAMVYQSQAATLYPSEVFEVAQGDTVTWTDYSNLQGGNAETPFVKDGAADKAGIQAGDIIVTLGGHDVDSLATLTRVLRHFKAGQNVSVIVYRNGQQETLSIVLDEKPAEN